MSPPLNLTLLFLLSPTGQPCPNHRQHRRAGVSSLCELQYLILFEVLSNRKNIKFQLYTVNLINDGMNVVELNV